MHNIQNSLGPTHTDTSGGSTLQNPALEMGLNALKNGEFGFIRKHYIKIKWKGLFESKKRN